MASRFVDVLGSRMHVLDSGGGGTPVLFLHGNPTSSHLWRHVISRREGDRRCIAADLIGMGRSGKPAIGYHLADHIRFVDALVEALGLSELVLVGHDWGVAIALDRLRRYPRSTRGVAVMEGHIRPLDGWDDFDPGGREIFQQVRTPGVGERMVLDENFMVDTLLPAGLTVTLSEADLAVYREPYADRGSRLPLLQWAREIPIAGDPEDVARLLSAARENLASSPVPKLLVHGRPGAVISADGVAWCRQTLTSLTIADVGEAGHFLPEDRPGEVAAAVWQWLRTVP
jgi:haloalkane dehalogenase